ncbi:MAG: VOC family protein [Gordonia sp. (in: high G+C Gram-positive bacteria)]|uniref:VOC family protein n=1 Tax=Gordonia sp. (in: high G+C Gram-positive bacteria) TaxID=84139 RepID=UPI0039E216A1
MTIRMDNVGIVVDDLTAMIDFLTDLGLRLEGRSVVAGAWAGQVTGLGDQHVEIAMMQTPDGSRIELSRFNRPAVIEDHRGAPVNALGYLRVMFEVDDLDDVLDRAYRHGAVLISDGVVEFENVYRLCYLRGPENILFGLAQKLPASAKRPAPEPAKADGTVSDLVDDQRG